MPKKIITPLLSSHYLPCLHYFYYVVNSEEIIIDGHEHYAKQSYRNRTQILSANGKLDLIVPVIHRNNQPAQDVRISYSEKWQRNHWRAIYSAYRSSPYFSFFEDELRVFYEEEREFLLDYNTGLLETILKILRLKKEILFTSSFEKNPENIIDLREKIHPKISYSYDAAAAQILVQPYYQTFGTKFGFTPNLSILDLLFNKGKEAVNYLQKI
jgi:hypothetical protein